LAARRLSSLLLPESSIRVPSLEFSLQHAAFTGTRLAHLALCPFDVIVAAAAAAAVAAAAVESGALLQADGHGIPHCLLHAV
jgi:hypothetical protein